METYNARRDELLPREGEFVVIKGDRIAGIWQTYEDALKAGYNEFKLEPFMVKQILAVEPVHYVTRGTPTCPFLSLPIGAEGAIVDVFVALSTPRVDALKMAGMSFPPPEKAKRESTRVMMSRVRSVNHIFSAGPVAWDDVRGPLVR